MKAGAKTDIGFPDVDALIKDAVGDALKDAGIGSGASTNRSSTTGANTLVTAPQE